MAAEIAETVYDVSPNLGTKIIKFKYTAAANGDWVIFPNPIGAVFATDTTGAQMTTLYAVGDVTATTVATATQTTVPYDGATAAQVPTSGYCMIDNEIIHFTAGGAAADGTLTGCTRGWFGTTAATHAENAVIYFLNTVVFSTTTGLVRGIADVIEE